MIFNKKHNVELYNILLKLSRNIFFYKKIQLNDSFETRIFLMFFHFSILMIIFKKKGEKFDQDEYDNVFNSIEYNLRELGFGDVSVNKKMKDFNKILYDILLKIDEDSAIFQHYYLAIASNKGNALDNLIAFKVSESGEEEFEILGLKSLGYEEKVI